ncbi:hypothetical protein IMZ48_04630 [Candidatus Bathyarchaeota archaeon]|nr:hypothetical protein [Candidatus Bathyarchaeota archaeon]
MLTRARWKKVKFANDRSVPFLAYNGAHGASTTLAAMDGGIEIYLENLSGVEVSKDGETATIGGGTGSKLVIDTLWEAGKQTGKRKCPYLRHSVSQRCTSTPVLTTWHQ